MSEKMTGEKGDVLRSVLVTVFFVGIATFIGWLFRRFHFPEANIVVVYILSVILTARFTDGYIYGLAATIAATAAFNYVFTDPYFTFSVSDPTYFITFSIMTITSIITSALTSKVKKNALEAKENERKAQENALRAQENEVKAKQSALEAEENAREWVRSREEAAQERYRGNLLRAISHDLRTPLSGIMGTSEMLMDMTQKEDQRYSLAEGIYKDADWLHSLVENILNLTRLQEGRLVLNKQMEAVEEVVGAAVAVMAKRAPEYEISVKIPDDVMIVPMDARLIDQVLVNLLDNAVKHTEPGKEIAVEVQEDKENKMAVFLVSDRGVGIAPKDLDHVFQMFYTTHGKDTDTQRGMGLGLAICESIVNAHGGTITAKNREDGSGAQFIFTLPMEEKEDAK